MTCHLVHTHVCNVLLEYATRPFLVAGYDVLVALALQPPAKTELERVSAPIRGVKSTTRFVFDSTQQTRFFFRSRTSGVEDSKDLHVSRRRRREEADMVVPLSVK